MATRPRLKPAAAALAIFLAAVTGSFASMLALRATARACSQCIEYVIPAHPITQAVIIGVVYAFITAMEEYLIEEILPLHAGQVMGSAYGSQMLPASNISAFNSYSAILERQKNAADVHQKHVISANICQGTSGVRGLRNGLEGTDRKLRELDITLADFFNNATQSQLLRLQQRFKQRMDRWCDPTEVPVELGVGCIPPPGPEEDDHVWVNADVKIGRMLWQNTAYTKAREYELAFDMVANLTTPLPQDPLAPSLFKEPRGKLQHIRRTSYQARMNAAGHALNWIVAERFATTPMGDWMKPILVALGAPEGQLDLVGDNNSLTEFLSVLMAQRFMTTQYGVRMLNAPPAAISRETAQLVSFQLMMQWRTYELMERYLTLEATDLAMDVEKARDDLMDSADRLPAATPTGAAPGGQGLLQRIFGP